MVLRSNRIHLDTAISVFGLMLQLFFCAQGARIVQESRFKQESPRVDVHEAPCVELLCKTQLVAIHDPIKLLNSDDNLELRKETLPIPTQMQTLDSGRGVACVARELLSRSPISPPVI